MWRKGRVYVEPDDSISRYPVFAEECADDLEAALPKWTKITDDPDTWPEDGQRVIHTVVAIRRDYTYASDFYDVGAIRHWIGRVWRPFCDLDYPPEQS